jgi:hypothetical protein
MKQLIKISQVKSNPNNPRLIKNDKFKKLVKSVQDFPEMLELRPIVVDENMIVLGGNMRLKACIEAGLKEVWIEVANLTEQQKKKFTIKDNVGFGEWDWDELANTWDAEELNEWGLDVPFVEKEIDSSKEGDDIKIDKSLQVLPKQEYVIIYANSESEEWDELRSIFKCKTVRQGGCKVGSTSDKATTGLERVFNLQTFKERLGI